MIDGLHRRDIYELPTRSVREMIANAVLHRSYLDDSSIQVSLYDDRLEIDSPGMLFEGLTLTEALSGKSRCRNKAIAEAFQYMKLVEGWGTGLPRLFRNCEEMGLPRPEFTEFGDGIKVIIYRTKTGTETDTNDTKRDANEKVNTQVITQDDEKNTQVITQDNEKNTQDKPMSLPITEQIVEYCREPRNILEIAGYLGYKERKTVRKFLAPLIEQGIIVMTVPDKPNSRYQKYITAR